jgi:hypothetical protein
MIDSFFLVLKEANFGFVFRSCGGDECMHTWESKNDSFLVIFHYSKKKKQRRDF